MADKYEIYMKKFSGKTNENNGWLIFIGIMLLILGIGMLYYVFMVNIIVLYFIGAFIIANGVLQFINIVKVYDGFKAFLLSLVALSYIAAGALTIAHPLVTGLVLTVFIAIIFMSIGVLKMLVALQIRPFEGWHWGFFAGIITLLTGVLIFATPNSFTWLIGLFIALDILFQGAIFVTLGFAIRALKRGEK